MLYGGKEEHGFIWKIFFSNDKWGSTLVIHYAKYFTYTISSNLLKHRIKEDIIPTYGSQK